MSDTEINEYWDKLVGSYAAYINARRAFFQHTTSEARINLIKEKLIGKVKPGEIQAAIDYAKRMSVDELKEIFPALLEIASYTNGYTLFAQEMIWKMPKDWLVENIELHAESILANASCEEYWGLLTLYAKIDSRLVIRLANRASVSDDEDIRDAGLTYLERFA